MYTPPMAKAPRPVDHVMNQVNGILNEPKVASSEDVVGFNESKWPF